MKINNTGAFLRCIVGIIIANVVSAQEPTVNLRQGSITGVKVFSDARKAIYAYLGVPYAEPPTGDLRFAAPERHQGWNRSLYARDFGPSCPQLQEGNTQYPIQQDEDCLYLNIWTPEVATNYRNAPVVVFLEGEGFVSGSASRFPGQDLAAEGVVVVSANYRLNVFGFFCLEDAAARGNLGLLDQYLALVWVHENIEAFGGDARSVTLMGHSAGAASVVYQMVSPRTPGLFHRAVLMSGSATSPWSASRSPGNSSRGIAKSLGCLVPDSYSVLRCLRAKSTPEILTAFQTQYKNGNWSDLMLPVVDTFLPVEAQFLPQSPTQVLGSPNYNRLPVLTGITGHEGAVVLYELGDVVRQGYQQLRHFFEGSAIRSVMQHYGFSEEKSAAIHALIKWQYVDLTRVGDTSALLGQLLELYSDAQFRAPHAKQLELFSRSPEALFVYEFLQTGGPDIYGSTINISGAAHGSEFLYLLGPSMFLQATGRRFTPSEDRFSKIMKRFWVDFIRLGNPVPGPYNYGYSWKRYIPEENNFFSLASNLQQQPASNMVAFWNELLPRLNQLATSGDNKTNSATTESQIRSDPSQPFRNAMYTLIGFVSVLFILLIICVVMLKKRTKERDRELF